MIETNTFIIKKTPELTSGYIESELEKSGIVPLRWSIVDVSNDSYTVSVAYEKNNCDIF